MAQLQLDVDQSVDDKARGVAPRIRFYQPKLSGIGHGDEGHDAGRAVALDGVAS